MATTTVTATYLKPNGSPAQGRVTFRLVETTYQETLDAIMPTVTVSAVLDAQGQISIELEPTSGVDLAFDSTTLTYEVQERINGANRDTYWVDIPTAPSVDLGTLTTYETNPAVVRQLVTPDLSTLGFLPEGDLSALTIFMPEQFGTCPDAGTSDVSAYVQAAIDAAETQGGIVQFLAKTYRCDSRLVVPNDGEAIYPRQKSMVWQGMGSYSDPVGGSGPYSDLGDVGGTILDLRYTGGGTGLSKIFTNGKGRLEITGITFTDHGTSSNPFLKTTNTELQVHECAFVGNDSKDGITCDQDAIILGGLDVSVTGGNGADSAFQGYGTVIRSNHFARIRRAVYWRKYANAVIVENNNVWISCGSDQADGGAFDMDPGSGGGGSIFGNVVTGNLIEVGHYPYPIRVDYAQSNTFIGNNFYDPGATCLAYIAFLSLNAKHNTVITGFGDSGSVDAAPHVVQVSPSALTEINTVIDGLNTTGSTFSGPVTLSGGAVVRSASGDSGPNLEFGDPSDAGTARVKFTNYGRTWGYPSATGGDLLWDTGTGGSYANIRAFGTKILTHTGTLRAILGDGIDGIKLGASSDVWFARQAAGIGRVMTSASVYAALRTAYLHITQSSAPATGDIDSGSATIWFDPTNGASKLMIKAKQADGTVKTGELPLS